MQTVELLLRAELLSERDHALEFVHPLVREAIYSTMGAPRRDVIHARAAKLLADDGAGAGAVAAQLLRAAPAAEALAGRRAVRRR